MKRTSLGCLHTKISREMPIFDDPKWISLSNITGDHYWPCHHCEREGMLCAMQFMFPDCKAGFIVSQSIFHLICRLKREEVSEVVRCWPVDMPKDTATISYLQEVSGSSPRKCRIMVRTLLVVFRLWNQCLYSLPVSRRNDYHGNGTIWLVTRQHACVPTSHSRKCKYQPYLDARHCKSSLELFLSQQQNGSM